MEGAVLLRHFPGPDIAAVGHLFQGAVLLLLNVHQGHIALVHLGLLVHQLKDALCTGHTHDHQVDLLGHLADGAGELTGHVEEGNGDADAEGHAGKAQVGSVGNEKDAAHNGHQGIDEVAGVHEDGHEGVGVGVGLLGVGHEGVVEPVEVGAGLGLVTEHLDHLLAVHELLHEALHLTQGLLLPLEEGGGLATNGAGEFHHHQRAQENHQAQPEAVVEHDHQHGQNGDEHGQQLREALGYHLAQGVDVVGVVAHDIAVVVGVKVAQGQVLHAVEHLYSQLFQQALGDDGHQLGPHDGGNESQGIHGGQNGHQPQNLGGSSGPVTGLPVGLDDSDDLLHEHGGKAAHDGTEQDTHQSHGHQHREKLEEGAQQANKGAFAIDGDIRLHLPDLLCSETRRLPGRWGCSSAAPRGCPWPRCGRRP